MTLCRKGCWGFARTPLFKAYVACIEKSIPLYDPKGNLLGKETFSPESLVLAVILECEPFAKKFGKKYGNDLAYALQHVANQRVSKSYGIAPLNEPEKYRLEYDEYVEAAAPSVSNNDPERPAKHIFDLLKPGKTGPQVNKTCILQIDGTNVSCDLVWYIEFKDGGYSVQFNKGTGDKPVVSFFGVLADPDTITVGVVQVRIGDRSFSTDEYKATGQCIVGKMIAQCQARLSDGRLLVGSIITSPK